MFQCHCTHKIKFTKNWSRWRTGCGPTKTRHPIIMWACRCHCWPWRSASGRNNRRAAACSDADFDRRLCCWFARTELDASFWDFLYPVSSLIGSTTSSCCHLLFGRYSRNSVDNFSAWAEIPCFVWTGISKIVTALDSISNYKFHWYNFELFSIL